MFGHPKGLMILFFTEMWERFSYYGMRALLVLYICASIDNGGLGWSIESGLALYGWYTMLVYVMSIPGGIIADKILGQKNTVLLGGGLLCLGHLILAIPQLWGFISGLVLIILGVGCLKPNISTMVGGLYAPNDARRDKGFTIFYIGINIGGLLAPLIVGYIGETYSWHLGFGIAGIGMIIGQLVYVWGLKHLKGVGDFQRKSLSQKSEDKTNHLAKVFSKPLSRLVTITLLILGVYVLFFQNVGYGLILICMAPFLGIGINIYKEELSQIEKDRVSVLLISFLIVIVFWGAFEQAGGLMNIYTKEKINRIVLGWEIPASVFQSVNAFFIITTGTLVAYIWARRRIKNKEASSIFKMALGTIIMGLGFILMACASKQIEGSGDIYGKAALYWLIGAYFLHTIGELCASPVALSFITKIAPVKYASLMMGLYFAASGFGNKLAGAIGEYSQAEPIRIELTATKSDLNNYISRHNLDSLVAKDKEFLIKGHLSKTETGYLLSHAEKKNDLKKIIAINPSSKEELIAITQKNQKNENHFLHATLKFEKDSESKKIKENIGDGKNYSGVLIIEEIQNTREYKTFLFITIFTVTFGLLLILFIKKLKKLTHGAEENEK